MPNKERTKKLKHAAAERKRINNESEDVPDLWKYNLENVVHEYMNEIKFW